MQAFDMALISGSDHMSLTKLEIISLLFQFYCTAQVVRGPIISLCIGDLLIHSKPVFYCRIYDISIIGRTADSKQLHERLVCNKKNPYVPHVIYEISVTLYLL